MVRNKEKLAKDFDQLWSAVEKEVTQKKRLPKYLEFAQRCWKNENQTYRDKLERDAQVEHEKALRDWKEKIETFNGTPEEFER